MRKSVKSMVDDAMSVITTYSVEEAQDLHGRDDVQFIDIRDVRELEREGVIPGAFHAPRGMLEFWVDPESPYHKPVFNRPGTRYVLFCAAGWRSETGASKGKNTGLSPSPATAKGTASSTSSCCRSTAARRSGFWSCSRRSAGRWSPGWASGASTSPVC